jgi:hypothetical protein
MRKLIELNPQPTYEMVLKLFIEELKEHIHFCEFGHVKDFSENPTMKSVYEEYATLAGMSLEDFMTHITIINKRKLRIVEKGLCKEAVRRKSCYALSLHISKERNIDSNDVIVHYENGKFYEYL